MSRNSQPAVPWQSSHSRTQTSSHSRNSYPSFLSLPETLKLHLGFLSRGLLDAFRWDFTIRTVYSDAEIRSHVLKSMVLNSLSLISVYTFEYLLLPLATRGRIHHHVGWSYRILWLLPLATVSLYLNGSWAGVVAKRSYILQYGTRSTVPAPSYTGMLTAIASSAYRVVMVVTSVILTNSLRYIPVIGHFAGFAFLCWVNAYYCFEFTWIARGLSLAQRVRFLEERWAYYLSFGLPSAALCAFVPGLASVALFALLLPFYIIKASNARPVPKNPYSPVFPQGEVAGTSPRPVYSSPFIPIRIPVFWLVIAIDNFVVRVLSVGTPTGSRIRTVMKESTEKRQLPGDADVAIHAEEGSFHLDHVSRRKPGRKTD